MLRSLAEHRRTPCARTSDAIKDGRFLAVEFQRLRDSYSALWLAHVGGKEPTYFFHLSCQFTVIVMADGAPSGVTLLTRNR